jgi:hypothetical protein
MVTDITKPRSTSPTEISDLISTGIRPTQDPEEFVSEVSDDVDSALMFKWVTTIIREH